ncbi:hypothetical protein ABZS98_39525 [Streptomyces avermitilis]|uniref:hypothetical protein n=1 Tax=Streptomyces avermitilis TaxID=33903 RepID=UPI0033A46D1C
MEVANEVLGAYSRDWCIDETPVSMHPPAVGHNLQPAVAAAQTIRRDLPRFLQALQPQTWPQTWAAMIHGGFTVTEQLLSMEAPDRTPADWTCAPQEETAHHTPPTPSDRGRHRTEEALAAIHQLAIWLCMPDSQTAQLLGQRRNYYNWLKGDYHPNPQSLASIHEAHALVKALIDAEGLAKTRAWLAAYADGRPRQQYLADSVGRAELARLAHDVLFPPTPVLRWEPDEDLDYDSPPPPVADPTTPLHTSNTLPPKGV